MADSDSLFKAYNDIIKLAPSYRANLRRSRDSLRDKVREKFASKGYDVKFHRQGSFAMNTIIKPYDDDYDVDDGIYMLLEAEPEEAISTLHTWVVEAARNHTDQEPIDRGPCVRVLFKGGYHMDLVVYYKQQNAVPKLAHKSKGWIVSDPKQFADWFDREADAQGQLKRLVRYFKAWKDNLRGEMPSGLILTILATQNRVLNERDDVAFLETMKAIRARLSMAFVCYRPTVPHEDLFAGYSQPRRDYFLARLNNFIQSGEEALAADTPKAACLKWKKHFGPRFPCHLAKDELEEAKRFDVPAFIRSDGRSALSIKPAHGDGADAVPRRSS